MDSSEFRSAAAAAVETLAAYVDDSATGAAPVVARSAPDAVIAGLGLRSLLRDGGLDAASFGPWLER